MGFLLKALEPNTTSDYISVGRFQQRWQLSAWRELFKKALDRSKCFNLNYSFYSHLSPRRSSDLFTAWGVNVRDQLQFTRSKSSDPNFRCNYFKQKLYLSSSKLILILPAHIRVRSCQVVLKNLCRLHELASNVLWFSHISVTSHEQVLSFVSYTSFKKTNLQINSF